MRWDPLLALATSRELERVLSGARIRALLLDTEARRVLLYSRRWTLVWELHPLQGWVTLLPPTEPAPEARPLPVRVRGVHSLPDESAIVLEMERVRGKDEGVEMIAEMVGNHWNAIVMGRESRVIRHVLVPREGKDRSLRAGESYRPPRSNPRSGASEPLPRETWEAIRTATPDGRTLLTEVAYLSSLNLPRYLDGDGWERWCRDRHPEAWTPYVLDGKGGAQPYPVEVPGADGKPAESLMEAFRTARNAAPGSVPPTALLVPPQLLAKAERESRRIGKKVDGLRRELEGLSDPAPIRARGDLILARFHEVPRGTARISLRDFEGAEVELELDPTLPPQENAARFYDEAARIERAREILPDRLEAARGEQQRLNTMIESVRTGDLPAEALDRHLGSPRGAFKGRRSAGGAEKGAAPDGSGLPYRTYRTSGGLEVRVGRGSRQNDDLTFHHSAPDDIWLHARHAQGAHVILRWGQDDNPPSRDLTEAAVLAALHSRARTASSAPVDWTRRKHVRKPRKSGPGKVVPARVQTLFVEPDPAVARRLSEAG